MEFTCYIHRDQNSESKKNIKFKSRRSEGQARKIFPSVTRVVRILLTTAATSTSVERAHFKEREFSGS